MKRRMARLLAALLARIGVPGARLRDALMLDAGPAPVRAREVERALIGEAIEENRLREICETLRKLDAIDDIHAPMAYRQQLATVLSRRALLKAHERIVAGRAA